jgi:mRNA-degrading endonuclease RelE of RelBE toxin-antitoxin system
MTGDSSFTIDRISSKAESYLRRLSRQQQKAVAKAFDHLCNVSPFRHPNPTVIKPLRGPRKGQWRYRIGGIRIVYTVDKETRTIQIVAIDTRGDVY